MPLWSYAHPSAIELAEKVASLRPRRPQPGLLHQRRRRGRRVGVEAGQELLQAHRQADEAQGHQPHHRLPRHHRRAPCRSPACRCSSSSSSRWCPRRSGCPTPTSTAPRQITGGLRRRRPRGVRPLGRRPDRRRHRERGPRHRRRRLPRAGAERRRLLPAAARLLRAGARDLRRARRPARLRRGHLRLRPPGPHVRRRALRLPARHHHLRQGHHLGLRPARRDDRQRPADGAVPRGQGDVRPRLHLRRPPGLDRGRPEATCSSSRRRACSSTCATNAPAFRATLERLKDLPIVGDVRGDGYFYGIELVKDQATRETFTAEECERLLFGFVSKQLFAEGLYCRADDRGDPVIQLAPPLVCDPGRTSTRWSRSCAPCSTRPARCSELARVARRGTWPVMTATPDRAARRRRQGDHRAAAARRPAVLRLDRQGGRAVGGRRAPARAEAGRRRRHADRRGHRPHAARASPARPWSASTSTGALEPVADALAALDEVDYVVVTAGRYDLLAEIVCESDDHLLDLISTADPQHPGRRGDRDVHVPRAAQAVLLVGRALTPDATPGRPGRTLVSRST